MTTSIFTTLVHHFGVLLLVLLHLPLSSNGFLAPERSFAKTPVLSSISQFPSNAVLYSTNGNDVDGPVLTSESSSASDQPNQQFDYNWKEQWYALAFSSHVPNPSETAEVTPASVFGNPLVLWKSQDNGEIYCADDICPHRAAALSEGRVRDGQIECYYHGWQFSGESAGACTFIPQLEKGAKIPKAACLRLRTCRIVEGIVWVWMGETDEPTKDPPTQGDGLDLLTGEKDGFLLNDFQIDLPYDHSYLVENLIDPAHVPISHDRTPGGGLRENAEAFEMVLDVDSMSADGFTGRYRTKTQQSRNDSYIEVQYEAPGIIRLKGFPRGVNSTIQFGGALHCMPLTLGRSRLLFRTYFGGLPRVANLMIGSKPMFLRHLNSCKVLEQDVGLITTQEDHFKRHPNRRLKDDFLMLNSADVFVKAYRQWLDRVGNGMPWFQGLATRSNNVDDHLTAFDTPPALDPIHHRASNHLETRYHRHVMHCPTTRNALKRVQQLKKVALTIAIVAITTACGLAGSSIPTSSGGKFATYAKVIFRILVPTIPLSCLGTAALHRLEQRFYVSFKRKDQMRTETGI